jgi:DNA-binding response OmpR family regulator
MMTPRKVLVVEDEKSMQILLLHVLSGAGYAVTLATNGLEAKQFLAKEYFDLICSDVMMSGVDGIELCTWVKSQDTMNAVPFVILSSCAQLAEIADGYKAGADYYLTKPFHMRNLLSVIATALVRESMC